MAERPLVVVMRPQPAADRLAGKLEQAGFVALAAPALEIVARGPVTLPTVAPDLVVFVSAAAARHGVGVVAGRLRDSTTVLAVGESTAAELAGSGLQAKFPEDARSEGLLAIPELADPAGRNVWIVRGVGGREHLADSLRDRGATVSYVEVYKRRPLAEPLAALGRWPHAFVVTSGAIFDAFHAHWPVRAALLDPRRAPLADVNVVVVSPRIAQMARASGYTSVRSAAGARDEALLASLGRWPD